MYIENASPVEGSDSSYVSDDNIILSGDENIVAPPESFSGRTEYVMSPELHMPVPLPPPPPINGHTDETGMESELLPPDLYQAHSPMEFTSRDFPDSFNLPNSQSRLSMQLSQKMSLNLKHRVYYIYIAGHITCCVYIYLFIACVCNITIALLACNYFRVL